MEHQYTQRSIVASVFQTNRYSMFKKLEQNRDVEGDRIDRLVASFGEKEILNPVVVNEKMEIIDGQGRYEACKILGLPIKYIISEGATVEDCIRMNRYNSKWTMDDYIASWSKNKDKAISENYRNLIRCMENIGTKNVARTLRLAGRGVGAQNKTDVVQGGKLVFTEEDIRTAERINGMGLEIANALNEVNRLNEAYWTGIKVMVETKGYDHERMVRNCRLTRGNYAQASNLENQLKEFSRIYNYKRTTGKLYFEDYMRNKGHNVRSYENNFVSTKDKTDRSTLKTL